MFDRKPIVAKPWRPEIKLNKEIIEISIEGRMHSPR